MRVLIVTDTYPPDINGVARTLHTLGMGLVIVAVGWLSDYSSGAKQALRPIS